MKPVMIGSPVAIVERISSRFRSVWSNAATPTTHNNDRPYFTNAAGPSRNSPLPIDTPSTITPGPIALNHSRPFGRGGGGNSPRRHASSPERASGAASLTACVLMVQKGLQHNALVVFFELLVWFYLSDFASFCFLCPTVLFEFVWQQLPMLRR